MPSEEDVATMEVPRTCGMVRVGLMSIDGASTARTVALGLGSNLGNREVFLRAAVDLLKAIDGVRVVGCSSLWETAPVGPPQPLYLNAIVHLSTTLAPIDLLAAVLSVEAQLGRVRDLRWGPRTIDIDVVWIEGVVVAEPSITVPHPRLRERGFVLVPLAEVLPNAADPITGELYRELQVPADHAVVRVGPFDGAS